jgi:DNA-binding XRE family transcriptional regulator
MSAQRTAPAAQAPAYHDWQQRRLAAFAEAPATEATAPGSKPLQEPTPAEALYPAEPVPLPGTPQRKALLHERALAGAELHQAGDVVTAPDQRADYRRLRNGHDRIDQQTGVAVTRPDPGEKAKTIGLKRTSTKQMYELLCPGLKALGQRLRELRGRRTRGQIALASGVHADTLRKLEEGLRPRPRVDTLLLLAEFFKVSLDELVGRKAR